MKRWAGWLGGALLLAGCYDLRGTPGTDAGSDVGRDAGSDTGSDAGVPLDVVDAGESVDAVDAAGMDAAGSDAGMDADVPQDQGPQDVGDDSMLDVPEESSTTDASTPSDTLGEELLGDGTVSTDRIEDVGLDDGSSGDVGVIVDSDLGDVRVLDSSPDSELGLPDASFEDVGPADSQAACAPGTTRCGDQCVDTQSNSAHCGACDNPCAPIMFPNMEARCIEGQCRATCRTGFGNCDNLLGNGCEVDLRISPLHCGGCEQPCTLPNATPACVGGACFVNACSPGFASCDGQDSNGCEVDLRTSTTNCGRCGNHCNSHPFSAPSCAAGICGISCESLRGDCDGSIANGCEENLALSRLHCARCGQACASGEYCTGLRCARPPRQIGPISGSIVGRDAVILRHESAGWSSVDIEICASRSCENSRIFQHISGTRLPEPVPPGVWYWRVRGRQGESTSPYSALWQVRIPDSPAARFNRMIGLGRDFNGDGIDDLAVGNSTSGRTYIFWGPITSRSAPALEIPTPSVSIAGDVNGDGFLDLLAAGTTIRLGEQDASLTREIAIGLNCGMQCGGDLDGDGYSDCFARTNAGGCGDSNCMQFRFLFGGSPNFRTAPSYTNCDSTVYNGNYGFIPDHNEDGVDSMFTRSTYIFSGSLNGSAFFVRGGLQLFGSSSTRFTLEYGDAIRAGPCCAEFHTAEGDVNGDGWRDIVIGFRGGTGLVDPGRVRISLAQEGGAWREEVWREIGGLAAEDEPGASTFASVDIDTDGYDDLFFATAGTLSFHRGGVGVWAGRPTPVPSYSSASFEMPVVRVGDLNGDGHSDIAARMVSGGVAVWYASSQPFPRPPDFVLASIGGSGFGSSIVH